MAEENRRVTDCVVESIKFLSSQIAFWGDKPSDGKFMSLFRLMAKRDASASGYLAAVDKAHSSLNKMAVNFLSPANIRLPLLTMKKMVVEQVVQDIRVTKKHALFSTVPKM